MSVILNTFGVLFLILFLIFLFPVSRGVLNIGNISGMIFCVIMMFLTFGHRFISELKKSTPGKILFYVVIGSFLLGIIYTVFATVLMIRADTSAPREGSTVIVLGCQVRGDRPSKMLMDRIEAAKEYLDEHPDAVCIVSGGKGEDEQLSEAQCMYENLTAMGISSERIYMEDRSTNTKENISYSKDIIEKNDLSRSTAIVTDVFHEYRASRIVEGAGLEFGSVPAHCAWYLVPTFYVRELAAIGASFFGAA